MSKVSEARSRTMRAVKGRDTTPERLVRRLVHGLGFRFRLYRRDLPGSPDLVLPRLRTVIFVHGCFWHGHDCARGCRVPVQNRPYWQAKIARNRTRDRIVHGELRAAGWRPVTVWECELKDAVRTRKRIARLLARRAFP